MKENKETIWDMAVEHAKKEKKHQPKNINFSRELLMTFSNQKSLLSSKKIERFVIFVTFLVLTVVYIVKNMQEMNSMEFIEVIGLWLAYGGYNSFMNIRDRKVDSSITYPSESSSS